jgi:Protein of unknown function (DUF2867)
MRLSDTEHTTRPWRIHEIAPDFRIEDVWAYRTPGAGPDDFPLMLAALRAAGGLNENPRVVRFLFAVRWKLGALFGWDRPQVGLGRVESLCDRLPVDLRQDSAGEAVPNTPFTMVYELPDECAIELANKTVHGVCHLSWVPKYDGEYELRMAALVKPNGLLGRLYMVAIKPFRYLVIYPALTRKWERAWRERDRHLGHRTTTSDPGQAGTGTAAVRTGPHHHDEPPAAAPREGKRIRMIKWAGRLIVFYGAAHTLGALLGEGAARHAGAWFSGELWGQSLADMSPAMSAYWLSVNSFGPALILLGLTVLWLNRRGITPPRFLAWSMASWVVVGTVVAGPGIGQDAILLVAAGLLLAAAHAARRQDRAPSDPAHAAHSAAGSKDITSVDGAQQPA